MGEKCERSLKITHKHTHTHSFNQVSKRFNTNKTVTSLCAANTKNICCIHCGDIAAAVSAFGPNAVSLSYTHSFNLSLSFHKYVLCVQVHVLAYISFVHMEQYRHVGEHSTIHLNYKLRIKSTIQLHFFLLLLLLHSN